MSKVSFIGIREQTSAHTLHNSRILMHAFAARFFTRQKSSWHPRLQIVLIRLTGAHLYFHLLAPLTILFLAIIIIMNTTFSYESQNVFKTYFLSSGHSGKRGKYSMR